MWRADGERVLYMQDSRGDENWRLYAADPKTAKVLDLSTIPNARTIPVKLSYRRPHEVVVLTNDRDPAWRRSPPPLLECKVTLFVATPVGSSAPRSAANH
ncbi:hypothetical protein [Nannocystis radixulma]|uniref:Dipeptidylpeptidase IV N-terminal domain-containing protein n=1 Tax=Nannocystis radixulma TaxID=2995305 RepID=A0ABT5BFQ4_9BACT|nr:hypothetical protein [Nannocystis radixulma]MDC0671857.1 hypothetical protein [Nannocystis radixulma]